MSVEYNVMDAVQKIIIPDYVPKITTFLQDNTQSYSKLGWFDA